jgi:glyoxylase-like metal-dependent hydrolase (beta-lactamase superfamily II)
LAIAHSPRKSSSHEHAAGVDSSEITKVVFTHAHPDHIWGTLTEDGSLRFPNARFYIGAAEWSFWMDPDYRANMPDVLHAFAEGARRDLGAVRDRVVLLRPGDEVVPGIRALSTPCHTPGHLSFELDGDDGMIITADATTSEIVSIEHPDWLFGNDTIPSLAAETRLRLVDRTATDRIKLLGYHWTYPGVGFVERSGGSYRFTKAL